MSGARPTWFERNARNLFRALIAVCIVLVGVDVAHLYHRHGHFAWEEWPAFHAWFGFVVFVAVVYAGKLLRRLVMRDEDYYE